MSTWFSAAAVLPQLRADWTVATIWLIPVFEDGTGWRWAFAFLAPGPLLGIAAMMRLRASPEARLIAGGRG
jgi:hypothetical protein